MLFRALYGLGLPPLLLLGCMGGETRRQYEEGLEALKRPSVPAPTASVAPPGDKGSTSAPLASDDEAELSRGPRLPTILRLVSARNPDLRESRARAQASFERVPAAGRLPDLELKYEQWGVPLGRPYALDDAQMLMVGLRQTFPALGTLDARARGALEEARAATQSFRVRALELAAQAQRAYYEYYRADRELQIHLEHAELATRMLDLTRAGYRAGRGNQQAVLRAMVEASRLHSDVFAIEQHQRTSRALLNTLMARPPDAPLGSPPDFSPAELALHAESLEPLADAHRPELAAAAEAIRERQAALELAQAGARWPALMLGADYWNMPANPSPHAYSLMVAITLPWLNPRHREEVREAESALEAEEQAAVSARNITRYQIRDALWHLQAAQKTLRILDQDVLPQAQKSYEAAQAAFGAGQGDALALLDALRAYLEVRLERTRALATLGVGLADLERAVGTELADLPANDRRGRP